MSTLLKKLNDLGRFINERYPYINCGGCCVYAAIVATELERLGLQPRGVVSSWRANNWQDGKRINIDSVRPKVKKNTMDDWVNNGVGFSHVAVEFEYKGKRKHYDSEGVTRPRSTLLGDPVYRGRLLLSEMKELAAQKRGWNTSFDRKHIPAIRRLVKKYLADVQLETA